MKKQLLWLVLLIALVATCKHKDPEPALPPETQAGAGTFGCMLNGKIWIPSKRDASFSTLYVSLEGNGVVNIFAVHKDANKFEEVAFFSPNISSTGDYIIKKDKKNSARFWDLNRNDMIYSPSFDVTEDGLLTITKFDMANQIVSGRFWFKLVKQDGSASYEATDGRFDIKF